MGPILRLRPGHLKVPAGRYAVFTHRGHVSELPKTVRAIWDNGLSQAGLTPIKSPDFEKYGPGFDPETGHGLVEVWIPVEG